MAIALLLVPHDLMQPESVVGCARCQDAVVAVWELRPARYLVRQNNGAANVRFKAGHDSVAGLYECHFFTTPSTMYCIIGWMLLWPSDVLTVYLWPSKVSSMIWLVPISTGASV